MEPLQDSSEPTAKSVGFLTKIIGSGLYTGFAPAASGTFGSLAGLAFVLIPGFMQPQVIIPATFVLFYLGGRAAEAMEQVYGQDPSEVTVDEIVG
ncbi:MAG: phosphatidylglycerophosphatase A, partial [Bacteroidetes bacterium]|nr:phosphatidylglycerophosphatase A [Bacteroidota bacterium]